MLEVTKGSKTDLADTRYTVTISAETVDIAAVLLSSSGKVRSDDDFIFFNNPTRRGVALVSDTAISVDLSALPADIDRVLITGSTEAHATTFGSLAGLSATVMGERQAFSFRPDRLTTETVLQLVAFYRRSGRWRLDAIGQGYSAGLATFATDHGIVVDDPGQQPASPAATAALTSSPHGQMAQQKHKPAKYAQQALDQPVHVAEMAQSTATPHTVQPAFPVTAVRPAAFAPPAPQPAYAAPVDRNSINFQKVKVAITKDSPSKSASIDLRKSGGDPGWILTVGLEWDGRGAVYDTNGRVKRFGSGDLDVYFYCRNEKTNEFVVISGEHGHRGNLNQWPFIYHYGDSLGPGQGNRPAVEQVRVRPVENGDLLVNVYQSVDNGTGAINTFGRPRVAIRYGRPGPNGVLGPDADEIMVYVGNSRNCYWATVAHIDVKDAVLTVDGKTRYSTAHSEWMPGLNTNGKWVREPRGGPIGRSKRKHNGIGLSHYAGRCPAPTRSR
ncbi:TerD family protein [Nocardia beijingensis]